MRTADPRKAKQILEAAGELFAIRHYHEVRMEDVAARAGVAKGTLYAHFKRKEDLYIGLILGGFCELTRRVEEQLSGVAGAENRLLVLIRESIDCFARTPYLVELTRRIEMLKDADENDRLRELREHFLTLIASIIREMPGGAARDELSIRIEAMVLAGSMREVLFYLPQPWPDDLALRLTSLFLRGAHPAQGGGSA